MVKKNDTNTFLKGTLSLSLAAIITKFLGVLYKVPLSYILDDEGMGYFNTAYAIYGFFYILCTAGVPKAVSLLMSENSGDEDASHFILKKGTVMFLKVGLATCALIVVLAPALVNIIGNKKSLYTVIVIAPSIVFVSVSGVLRGYLNSGGRLITLAVSQFFEALIKLVLGLCFALIGWRLKLGLPIIAAMSVAGITVGSLMSCVYLYICAFSKIKNKKARQNMVIESISIRKRIVSIALPIALSSSLLNLSSIIDLTVMMKRLTDIGYTEAEANALYGNYTTLAVPMLNLVMAVITPITMAYFPKLSELGYRMKSREYSQCLQNVFDIVVFITVPCFCMFLFYGFDILDTLFSVQSSLLGADMLGALAPGVLLLSILTVVNTGLEARGKIALTVISLLTGCVVKSVVTYVLIGVRGVGMLGAPLGTAASYLFSLAVSVIALEGIGVKIHTFRRMLSDTAMGLLAFYLPYKLIYAGGVFKNLYVSFFACAFLSGVLYLGLKITLYFLRGGGANIKSAQKS